MRTVRLSSCVWLVAAIALLGTMSGTISVVQVAAQQSKARQAFYCCRTRCPILYAIDRNSDELLRIEFDLHNGVANAVTVGSLGMDVYRVGLDFAPDGTLWGVFELQGTGDEVVVTIDTNTGLATEVVPVNTNLYGRGIAFAEDCKTLYMLDVNRLWTVDVETGDVQLLATNPGYSFASLERTPLGYFALGEGDETLYKLDTITGEITDFIPLGIDDSQLGALAYSTLTGQLFTIDNYSHNLIRINPLTGNASVVAVVNGLTGNCGGLVFEPTSFALGPVSEPAP